LPELRDDCRRQSAAAGLDAEVVLPQIVDQLADRSFFLEPDLRMRRDVVGEREELLVHQLFRARDDLIAVGVRPGQPRDDAGNVGRASWRERVWRAGGA